MNIAILVNNSVNNYRGLKKWSIIKSTVLKDLPSSTKVIEFDPPFDIDGCILNLISNYKINCIISAGGDGSVNYLVNSLMKYNPEIASTIMVGAIGLGSSNDFLKPFKSTIKRVPVRINYRHSSLYDIGKVDYIDLEGKKKTRYFIVNSSIGVTADANLLFNTGDILLDWFKPRFLNLAIYYAAIKTIIQYRNKPIRIIYNNVIENTEITNISVIKNPNISGSFKYDQKINSNDGFLGLNYCYQMKMLELLNVLYDLTKGQFSGKPKRFSSLVKSLKVESDELLTLETDGEVILAKNIEFSILPEAIKVIEN